MSDPRAEYARRFVDRIVIRGSGLYWPVEVEPVRVEPASVVDAWCEMWGWPLVTSRDDVA